MLVVLQHHTTNVGKGRVAENGRNYIQEIREDKEEDSIGYGTDVLAEGTTKGNQEGNVGEGSMIR